MRRDEQLGELTPEQVAGIQRRVSAMQLPARTRLLRAGILLASSVVLAAIAYGVYLATHPVAEQPVEVYSGVHIAPYGKARQDADAAISAYHASPEYAAALERGQQELAQEASAAQIAGSAH